jgi:NTE family protein
MLKMKTALVLSGGGSKGAIQAGALEVVMKKLKPDMIVGTSVGSLNGAAIADGDDLYANAIRLKKMWYNLDRKILFPINTNLFSFHSSRALFSNKGLYNHIEKNLTAKTFEDLFVPLYVNCTNMYTGKSEFFSKGKIIDPLVASCSAAPAYPPVEINNIPYIDGAFGSVLGIEKIIRLGCKKAVIINTEHYTSFLPKKNSIAEYTERILAINRTQSIESELNILKLNKIKVIEVSPEPLTYELLPLDFLNVNNMIKLGNKEAKKVLDY